MQGSSLDPDGPRALSRWIFDSTLREWGDGGVALPVWLRCFYG